MIENAQNDVMIGNYEDAGKAIGQMIRLLIDAGSKPS